MSVAGVHGFESRVWFAAAQRTWVWFTRCNFHIALIGYSLVKTTGLVLGFHSSTVLALSVGAAAQFVYCAEHLMGGCQDLVNHPTRVVWLEENRQTIRLVLLVCATLATVGFATIATLSLGVVLIAGFGVTVAYLFLFSRQILLSRGGVTIVKPVLVVVVWAIATAALPLIQAGRLGWLGGGFILYRSIILMANVVLADLLDIAGDRHAGIRTLGTAFSTSANLRTILGLCVVAGLSALILVANGASFLVLLECTVWLGLPVIAYLGIGVIWADLLLALPFVLMLPIVLLG